MMRSCLLLTVLLIACSSEPRPPAEPAPEEAVAPPPAPAAPVVERQDPTPEELPIAEDFQDSAAKITDDNFKAELDAIEKEMNAEP